MKNFKKLLSNQSGVSLIEVTAAAAISVIISLGIMKTNQTGQKGLNKVASDIDLRMWQQTELMPILSGADSCTQVLGGSGTSLVSARDVSIYGVTRDSQGGVIGSSSREVALVGKSLGPHLEITSVRHQAYDDSDGGSVGDCPLQIQVSRKNSESSFGADSRTITIPLKCRVDNPGTTQNLMSCQASGGVQDSLWSHAYSATPEYIASTRNVLIGASLNPSLGKLQISEAAPTNWLGSGIDTALRIENINEGIQIGPNIMMTEDANNCFVLFNGSNGNANRGFESCNNLSQSNFLTSIRSGGTIGGVGADGVAINSRNANFISGTKSVAIAANDSSIEGGYNLVSGQNVSIVGEHNHAFGSGIAINNNQSFMAGVGIGSTNTALSIQASTGDRQFTGAFAGGYRFAMGASNSGSNFYLSKTTVDSGSIATFDGELKVKGSLHVDQYFTDVTLSSFSGSAGGANGIVCSNGGGSQYTDCYCSNPNFRLISGGPVATGFSAQHIRESRPVSLTTYRVSCHSGTTAVSCQGFSGICARIKDNL